MRQWRGVGPGVVVAAAFMGPGTVTTATLAGARHGVTLLWALVFATVVTIILQEMSARLGLATGDGLGRALRKVSGPRWLGSALAIAAVTAVVSGAIAYEAGNLTGAGLGLESITGLPLRGWIGIGTLTAGTLLWWGRYELVERVLAACVGTMGFVFVATALLVAPDAATILKGAIVPSIPPTSELTALALVGTTIVPYNLFLHAVVVRERWSSPADLPAARTDLIIAISIGGVVSAAVVVTAAAALEGSSVSSASDMAAQLTPLLGAWASRAFALGYAAAGISSAITAPLAAVYTVLDTFGQDRSVHQPLARAVAITCIGFGGLVALTSVRPIPLIVFAQIVNGLLLPIVAVVLLITMNDRSRLGPHVNTWLGNMAGVFVTILCAALGIRAVALAL
jgi:Mn2+/Fe2+ NRAMP family transporter